MYNAQTELLLQEREKKKQERINRRNRKLNLSKVTDEFNGDIATPNMTQIGIRNENNQNFNVLDAGNPNPLSTNNINDRTSNMINNQSTLIENHYIDGDYFKGLQKQATAITNFNPQSGRTNNNKTGLGHDSSMLRINNASVDETHNL